MSDFQTEFRRIVSPHPGDDALVLEVKAILAGALAPRVGEAALECPDLLGKQGRGRRENEDRVFQGGDLFGNVYFLRGGKAVSGDDPTNAVRPRAKDAFNPVAYLRTHVRTVSRLLSQVKREERG